MLTPDPNSAVPCLIPPDVQALFGDPPLLRGEDDGLYHTLMERFAKLIEPKDMIEWWWVKDMTDHSWEIRRLRRFKVLFLEIQRDLDEEIYRGPLADSEQDSADFFRGQIDNYKNADRLIASAELRRDRTLREVERRREDLARRLLKASKAIAEDKIVKLPNAA
jgi:hypothetical protein